MGPADHGRDRSPLADIKNRMTDEETTDFQERPFICPYCGEETMVELPLDMVEILMARGDCGHCGKDFLIENDVPLQLPQ
jgi:transcription elongation factor Elf1